MIVFFTWYAIFQQFILVEISIILSPINICFLWKISKNVRNYRVARCIYDTLKYNTAHYYSLLFTITIYSYHRPGYTVLVYAPLCIMVAYTVIIMVYNGAPVRRWSPLLTGIHHYDIPEYTVVHTPLFTPVAAKLERHITKKSTQRHCWRRSIKASGTKESACYPPRRWHQQDLGKPDNTIC